MAWIIKAAEEHMDIKYEIKENLGELSSNAKGWAKELNLVSWNGAAAKYDIREWAPEHARMGKGVTMTEAEARQLYEILKRRFE